MSSIRYLSVVEEWERSVSRGDKQVAAYKRMIEQVAGKREKLETGRRLTLTSSDGSFLLHVLLLSTGQLLAIVSGTDLNGPVARMLDEFKACVEAKESPDTTLSRVESQSVDKLAEVQDAIQDVKLVMADSIDKALAKSEKLEVLQDKTESLEESAVQFKKGGAQLKRMMYIRLIKMRVLTVLFVIAILGVIILPLVDTSSS